MTAAYPPSIQDTVFAIAHRSQVRPDPNGVIFHAGDPIKAKLGKQRKVGTVTLALDYAILIHPEGLPANNQETIYFADGWRIERIEEVP